MTIQITTSARARMHAFLEHQPTAVGVRFGARQTGCSGFSYVVELADAVGGDDTAIEVDGVKLLVDAHSLPLVDGTTIDYRREGLNTQFVFENPNATGECGCGDSFAVD